MKALFLGVSEASEILLSQILVDGLRRRGYEVDHLLMDPSWAHLGLLRGVSREISSGEETSELRPSYALVVNLNSNPQAAKLATRLAHIKGFGYLFDSSSGRVVMKGKAIRYLALQHTSEKYPAFHRADLYESLLTEIEPVEVSASQVSRKIHRPFQVVATGVHGDLIEFPSCLKQQLAAVECDHIQMVDLAGRPLIEVAGLFQSIDLLVTDSVELALMASQFDVPVIDLYSDFDELNEKGPYSDGSITLGHVKGLDALGLSIAQQIQSAVYTNRIVSLEPRSSILKQIPEGPRLWWPDMENLTEENLWDLLLRFSSWVLHFRKPSQSHSSLLTRFSAGLIGENIHLHNRFLFHSQLQNIAIIQERLEELLQRSGGSIRESALVKLLKGTPLPRSFAMGWLGLKDDCRSQRPSVGLMYQVRLFVTHLKLQRQLLDHCLGIFEGDSEHVYSD